MAYIAIDFHYDQFNIEVEDGVLTQDEIDTIVDDWIREEHPYSYWLESED
jgi:hypothetical protein